jgi:pyruvate dehydrogenase E2 component (dihydrolipoamide acetyltransferase)
VAKIDVNVRDFGYCAVAKVLVKPGAAVKIDQSLVTLESDQATKDMPSRIAGRAVDVVTKGRRRECRWESSS